MAAVGCEGMITYKVMKMTENFISTGYTELDNLLGGGFKKGELIVIDRKISEDPKLLFHLATSICDSNNAVLLTLLGHEEYSSNIEGNLKCLNLFEFECGNLHLSDFQKHIQYHSHVDHI